ncbi:hypothetical protein HZF05_20770 [Sphingomonas sp. CGMCC 1.13654]|uniref:Uncharacterized protein n=1 Tax=Sphingomonas chungangi TaxID=2683589 RepID=A0A838LCD0_9SPHN|nr:hypothetical protein [Sphingomonas chungangi]MBA2936522.1 hypothetical protein [Sphingomonas chungangi]MVW55907.1 hypothetical protein [Sphingomonas chungangi]
MTETLTEARFIELADAYGAVVARWPEAVRADAMAMATRPAMQAVLVEAERLDTRLDLWTVEAPSAALRDRVISSHRTPLSRRARLWWSGIGIATALAGAVAGSVAASAALPSDHAVSDDATAFGDLSQQDS